MTLKYTIKKETWVCSDTKHLKNFLRDWASRSEKAKITGDISIFEEDGVLFAYRNFPRGLVQIVGDKEYLFDDEILDWFVKGLKTILKKDICLVLYFDFKDAVHNALWETGERTFLQYSDALGFKDIVEVKGIFGKSLYDFGLKLGKRVYKLQDRLISDNKASGLINDHLERIEENFKEWCGEKAWEE